MTQNQPMTMPLTLETIELEGQQLRLRLLTPSDSIGVDGKDGRMVKRYAVVVRLRQGPEIIWLDSTYATPEREQTILTKAIAAWNNHVGQGESLQNFPA